MLGWLLPGEKNSLALSWKPRLTAKFGPTEKLPANAAKKTPLKPAVNGSLILACFSTQKWTATNDVNGDGTFGALEGIISKILFGRLCQPHIPTLPAMIAATPVAMASGRARARSENRPFYTDKAAQYRRLHFRPQRISARAKRDDPTSPTYGMISWSSGSRRKYFFGDDNARARSWASSPSPPPTTTIAGTKDSSPPSSPTSAIPAPTPYRATISGNNSSSNSAGNITGSRTTSRLAPHFESWIMACYLWLYGQTGFKPLLERTRAGIKVMMEAYPKRWKWTNGIQQERARMLLPLAWLVRVDDTPEHRAWLNKMADDMLASQDQCGAIREELGDIGQGIYGAPKSNEAYGTAEDAPSSRKKWRSRLRSPIHIQFRFGLPDRKPRRRDRRPQTRTHAAAKLEEFIIRCQINCPDQPTLEAGWFREP